MDCVVSSNADASLAPPGKHILTCFVQYVPYKLRHGNWDEKRDLLGDRVVRKIAEYAPNVPNAIDVRQVLTPLDLERTYGLTEGNIFHGDLRLEQRSSSCVRCQDGRNIERRFADSICAEQAHIPAAGLLALPAAMRRCKLFETGRRDNSRWPKPKPSLSADRADVE